MKCYHDWVGRRVRCTEFKGSPEFVVRAVETRNNGTEMRSLLVRGRYKQETHWTNWHTNYWPCDMQHGCLE